MNHRKATKQVDAWNAVVHVGDEVRRWGIMHARQGPSTLHRTRGPAFVSAGGMPLVQLDGLPASHHLDSVVHPLTAKRHPILFMDRMVRALLGLDVEEPKTVTRRVGQSWRFSVQPGDRLWVRECWSVDDGGRVLYRSGGGEPFEGPRAWKPSIFMPAAHSRLLLRVLTVTSEPWDQVEAIDDAEARREGFPNATAFREAWKAMHPEDQRDVARIEFTRVAEGVDP